MLSYPFDALQVSFQQAVQGKGDDVVHVLELTEGRRVERETETERERAVSEEHGFNLDGH